MSEAPEKGSSCRRPPAATIQAPAMQSSASLWYAERACCTGNIVAAPVKGEAGPAARCRGVFPLALNYGQRVKEVAALSFTSASLQGDASAWGHFCQVLEQSTNRPGCQPMGVSCNPRPPLGHPRQSAIPEEKLGTDHALADPRRSVVQSPGAGLAYGLA